MAERRLLERLDQLKRRARRLLIAHGLAAVSIFALTFAFILVFVDWLVSLPGSLRLMFLAGTIALLLLMIYRRIVRPALARFPLEQIAARVEDRFPQLADRLVSTVNFLNAPPEDASDTSAAMREKVIQRTHEALYQIPIAKTLSLRSFANVIAVALVCTGAWATLAWATPHWPRIGVQRYLDPFGDTQWPRRTQILPITKDHKVALGDALPLVMQIVRGDNDSLRPTVHIKTKSGSTRVYNMQSELDGTYRWVTSPLTEDFNYWYEAGDDTTANAPFHVKVVKRPAVTTGIARIHPPPYAAGFDPVDVALDSRLIAATIGSRVEIIIETSKPLADDAAVASKAASAQTPSAERVDAPGAVLLFESGWPLPLTPATDQPLTFTGQFEVHRNDAFRIQLTDADGFTNRNNASHRVSALADEVPTITVVEPKSQLEVTPDATVNLLARIQDDFGLQTVGLTGRLGANKSDVDDDLTPFLQTQRQSNRIDATLQYAWNLAPLSLTPGDVVVYRLTATDNFPATSAHGPGSSAELRLKVVSQQEFAERLRDEFQLLRRRVRQLLAEQETLKDETDSVRPASDRSKPLTPGQQEAVGRLAGQQSRLAGRTEQMSRQFDRIIEQMEQNRINDEDAQKQARENAEALDRAANGPMAAAGNRLNDAQQAAADKAQAPMKEAGQQQQNAIETLEAVLQRMERWSNFSDVVRKTRDLLDRQEEISRDTNEVGKQTIGKKTEELASKEKTALAETARQQERLAEDTERLVERMGEMAEGMQDRDPAGSEALDSAGKSAGNQKIAQKMKQAAERIADNKASQASADQRQAEQSLREMLDKLEQRQRRQLEELAKRLEQIEDTLRHFIQVQETLLNDNQTAQAENKPTDVFKGLADGQSVLKRNTQLLAEDIGKSDEMARIARQVRKASLSMAQAAIQLSDGDGPNAQTAQSEALTELKLAADRIAELQSKTQQEMIKQDLAEIRGEVKQVRDEQQSVLAVTEDVAKRFAEQNRLMRIDVQKLSQLSIKESAIQKKLAQMKRQFGSADVYQWVLDRVTTDVDKVKKLFDDRDVRPEGIDLQKRVISRLDRLIDALKTDDEDIPEEEFAQETAGGGGGGGQNQKPNGIPPMAELKVLKAMQLDINDRTIEVAGDVQSADPTEQQLERIREIGDEQEQVRALAEKVIDRATR